MNLTIFDFYSNLALTKFSKAEPEVDVYLTSRIHNHAGRHPEWIIS